MSRWAVLSPRADPGCANCAIISSPEAPRNVCMTEPLAVIIAPDVISVDPQSVLNAALYFDVVYADCYSFSQSSESDPPVVVGSDGTLEVALDACFATGKSYEPL